MDIIPSDLATFGSEAKNLLQDLQSRNERMFLLTFLVVNMADTKRKLENDVFATAGIAQKNNCALTRLDYLQEEGFMSSNGNCILLDDGDTCVCPQLFSYSLLCKWFRIAVLPADKLLYAEINQTEDRKKCTECGAFFVSTSNSVKYCADCRKRIIRRQAAERMRKKRAQVTQ